MRGRVKLAVAVGLAVRIVAALALYHALPGHLLWGDDAFYLAEFDSLGHILRFPYPPYGFYMALVQQLPMDPNLAMRLSNGIFSTALVPLTWWVARQTTADTRIAFIAAWLTALSPGLVLWSVSLVREWMVAVAVAVCVGLVLAARRDRRLLALLLVDGLWLSYLRPYMLLVLVVVVMALLVFAGERRSEARHWAAAFLVLALALVPQLGELHERSQQYLYSESAAQRAPKPGQWPVTAAREAFRPSPVTVLTTDTQMARIRFLPGLAWYGLLPLLAVGLWTSRRGGLHPLVVLLAVAVLTASLSPWGLAWEPLRARVQVFVLLHLVAAVGLVSIMDWWGKKEKLCLSGSR